MRPRNALALRNALAALALRAALAATGALVPAVAAPAPAVAAPAQPAPARAEGPTAPEAPRSDRAATASPVAATEPRRPDCSSAAGRDFPLDTRIEDGPPVHSPGGGFELWSVTLTNTTARPCAGVHPVLVLTGRDRGLTPERVLLEYYDEGASRWRPAEVEHTAEDELVAVLGTGRDGGDTTGTGQALDGTASSAAPVRTPALRAHPSPPPRPPSPSPSLSGPGGHGNADGGFHVAGRATVRVKVRLALTADTPPNQVTVNAAVVQRRGDDGDWVGESDDYRFAVVRDYGTGTRVTDDELATTGPGSLLRLGIALGAVALGGGGLVLVSRTLRARRG
jgi:hypothetical protein